MNRNAQVAVLFDLDGTLVDTAPDLINALRALCTHADQPFPNRADWPEWVGQGAAGLIQAALGPVDESLMSAYLDVFLAHYESHIYEDSRPFPGIEPLIEACRSNGWPLGVVTNKKGALAQAVLEQSGLAPYFEVLIGGDTLTRNKPAPEPIWAACEALGIATERSVMIGDDQRDVLAAMEASVTSIVAGWGYGVGNIEARQRAVSHWCKTPSEVYQVLTNQAS